ncbi:3'(2'),5'-bisphosphate nucleotidase CysQ [Paramaledivibacter caminithermalis]|jgi:3'(2'), 5'-bisphosphate nucleotidase|uniref:3'(2'),5'-bisphosphate nucleotidase CysQ n=1 Tax=Paramaledivibacter caminithermalis (strain DSM 15212 / CIP 107654 / DViRD3) TaxID=1121301 RepID=A0A1M6QRZ7_PARC5|nr:3'(2'),5'-bisphosphate nucleotidase CysQ [Paramaledivibacter caminithermalis]SHK23062.1 3'(2'),5'-bisphosphate nucleotidase [Paramaledivibacter caminithermalis DSM 15212]
MNLSRELNISKILAVKAGEAIMKIYTDSFDIEYKEDESPITVADKRSNQIIIDGLSSEFPDYSILSEECQDDLSRLNNDRCFIVDPLDGTKEFIKKNGEFTVNIALAYKNRVVLGVIYLPATKELYYAAKGLGAYYQTKLNVQKISVSDRIENIRVMMSRSHATDKLKDLIKRNSYKISHVKIAGSSLKGCLIAKGEAEIYYRYSLTKEWDTAAMQCIVEEAGGIFKQIDDTDMLYNRENSLNDKGFYILNKMENRLI